MRTRPGDVRASGHALNFSARRPLTPLAEVPSATSLELRRMGRTSHSSRRARNESFAFRPSLRGARDEAMAPCDCPPMARHRRGGGTIRRPAASRRPGCRPRRLNERERSARARILLAGLAIVAGVVPAVSGAAQSSAAPRVASSPIRHRDVRVHGGGTQRVSGEHVRWRGAPQVHRRRALPAGKVVGLRRYGGLGCGRLLGGVHRRPGTHRRRPQRNQRRRRVPSTSPISDSSSTRATRARSTCGSSATRAF